MDMIEQKQLVEINYWRDSADESPRADSITKIIDKVSEAAVLLDCLRASGMQMPADANVLELGAGQGWASCVFKRLYPSARLTTTDISEYAIASLHKWEQLWHVQIDESYVCRSYETRAAAASVDLIFCFAAAHHFLAHNRTLQEISRILKPGGKAYYFYEPACLRYIYPLAYRRVNAKRPEVPEDVLILPELMALARNHGLAVKVHYYTSTLKRGRIETLYYGVLKHSALLQRLLPCTVNLEFSKPR